MLNYLSNKIKLTAPFAACTQAFAATACGLAFLTALAGCATTASKHSPNPSAETTITAPSGTNNESTNASKSLVLQEGDTIKIAFPGAPNLDTVQAIRRDGKISLSMIGEYDAAGKTPAAVETDLKKLYASQVNNSDASVTVQSSAFLIYVMGAVGRPGKLVSDRPLTALEALIESGIDDARANLKSIQIIRMGKDGRTEKFKVNLYNALHKKNGQIPVFTLKPYDVIRVPERFSFY